MSKFGADPHAFFDSIYGALPPWDIGGPQPALAALLDAYPPTNPILDVGCGSGDLALALAKQGRHVLGIDFVATAIAQAQAKRDALPPEIAQRLEFQVADAVRLSLLQRQFGAIVDSGFLHVLESEQRQQFAAELAQSLHPHGRYYLLAFAVEFALPNTPIAVSEAELRTTFTAERGWQIQSIQTAEFLSRVAPPVPAISACIERMPASA